MKRKVSFLLALCVLSACLTSCGSKVDVKKEIVGVHWEQVEVFSDEVETMLESYLFDPAEIAYANIDDFAFYRVMEFRDDGTVTLDYDTEKIRSGMYNALDSFLSTLYENKENLVDIYGQDFVDVCDTEEVFKEGIAYITGEMDTAEELLDFFADNVVTYYFSANQFTNLTGKYTVKDTKITVDFGDEAGADELIYDGELGTITTSDGGVFTKAAA